MDPFPVTRIAHIHAPATTQAWLVQHLWADQAVGFIGGTPKSGKTWLALELAVSVASGLPCLSRFPVAQRGSVILYAAEDSAQAIKQRVFAIARARGIDNIERLAVGLITEQNLRLDQEEHQQRLAATIEKLRPRLLVLDPLIRIHRSDENSAADVSLLLDYLRQLQRQYALAVVLVHHVRKAPAEQPGQALRGSGDLHAWSDSALYLLHSKDRLLLHAEHRSLPSPPPMPVELKTEPHPHLCVLEPPVDEPPATHSPELLTNRIMAALTPRPMTRSALRDRLGIRNERLGEALAALEAKGTIRRSDGLIAAVPVPIPDEV